MKIHREGWGGLTAHARLALAACTVALALSGCAQITNAWTAMTSASVSPTMVIVAANSFDAIEATATNYISLPKCTAGGNIVCADANAVAAIVPAVRSGRAARNNLEAFLKANPGQLGPAGLYNSLTAAISTLQAIIAQYNIGASK